jgi:predicted nuclease of restriction endonuclease-like (RecB) superfamily
VKVRDRKRAAGRRSRRLAGKVIDEAAADVVPLNLSEAAPETYPAFLADLKQRIHTARVRASLNASLVVNRELVLLYWSIGRDILARQSREGWGAKVIHRLAADLRRAFPDMTGISPRNLMYMRGLADAWPDEPIVQQLVAQLPWGHNTHLLDLVKCPAEREWYARQAIENGWSRTAGL